MPCVTGCFTPLPDGIACGFSEFKLMGVSEHSSPVFADVGKMLVVQFKHDGELVVCIIPLGCFQSHFFRHLLSIALVHHIICFRPERGNHMHAAVQDGLHAGIVPGSDFGPCCEAVAWDIAVDVKDAPTAIPFMGERVQDDTFKA